MFNQFHYEKMKGPLMESGKISFGLVLLLLIIFAVAGVIGWLGVSGTKTGIGLIDDNVVKVQTLLPQSSEQTADVEPQEEQTHDDHGHDHAHDDHSHDEPAATTEASGVPGKEGAIFEKPVSPILGERGVGDPNAPVQVREFFSLTCNHCAAFHEGTYQELKTKYIDTGKLYFIFEEFPLNGPALFGSMIARCMPAERYESFISLLLKEQDKWAFGGDFKSALQQNAALAGMSEEDFTTCYDNKSLQAALAKNIQVSADTWKISSTPTFVFNNGERIISGVRTVEDFEKVMAFLNSEESGAAPAAAPAPAPTAEPPKMDDTSININDLYEE